MVYKVGLVQINNSFSNHNYLPYSAGLLQTYYEAHGLNRKKYEFTNLLYKRDNVEKLASKLKDNDIVGFSSYIWNINLSRAVAKRVKELNPKTTIVFGGPQVPDRTEEFLRENPYIDIACNGEGERTFTDILDSYPNIEHEKINSIAYIKDDMFMQTPRGERIRDIGIIPSPYLSGTFDRLMQENNDHWLFLLETNRGCPFSCTFCDWGSAVAAKVSQFPLQRVLDELEWIAKKKIEFIFCCDANFGMLARDLDIARHAVKMNLAHGYPTAMSIQNTKNATERAYQIQKVLSDANLNKGVTLSLQSSTPGVLKAIKRDNISSQFYSDLQKKFTRDDIYTYTDFIIGLPEETYDTFREGVCEAIEGGQCNRIQFNNCSILPNAEMGNPDYIKKYGLETVRVKQTSMHNSIYIDKDEVLETEDIIISTNTMPKEDWITTRTFGWIVNFYYFNKIAQIPITILRKVYDISYKDIFHTLFEKCDDKYPALNTIKQFFINKAKDIQSNKTEEYCASEEYLGIWWPADELVFIQTVKNNQLTDLYRDLTQIIVDTYPNVDKQVIEDSMILNKELIKVPFQYGIKTIDLNSDMLNVYRNALVGTDVPLNQVKTSYRVKQETYNSWEQWYKEVVWYGNKKGAYLSSLKDIT